MIYLLTTSEHLCLEDFLSGRGAALAPELVPVPYSTLFGARRLPQGTYIFADLERLSGEDLDRAARLWRQLASWGPGVRLLNDPSRVKQRFELLRALHEHGLNEFDVYRLDEGRLPRRFPVFVRGERGHNATASDLLPDEGALRQFLCAWRARGQGLGDTVVTEFCGERDERGLYRRYAAFRVGERIVPTDIFFGRHWEVRGIGGGLVVDGQTVAEETRFLRDNPYEAQLREVFDLACIDYGRVDYGVVGGRVQVYEINTNPYVAAGPLGGQDRAALYEHFARDFLAALHILGGPEGASPRAVRPSSGSLERGRLRRWVRRALYAALWRSGPAQAYARRLRLTRRLVRHGKRLLGQH
ncbi:hypothetical protein [Deinococcus aestuarii]|uniref:hypothetical protein n=1 Tax=Deinococcus aestuarii TaxID=2774531 RepID=UPI001C0B7DBB|nr:hypothetical protein [Deinococcus aestuarii]